MGEKVLKSTMSTVCKIYSAVHESPDELGFTEGGYYEMPVKVSLAEAHASGDAKGFIQKEIARHLAGCISSTGIPLGVGMWRIEFTNFFCINFNFPEGVVLV